MNTTLGEMLTKVWSYLWFIGGLRIRDILMSIVIIIATYYILVWINRLMISYKNLMLELKALRNLRDTPAKVKPEPRQFTIKDIIKDNTVNTKQNMWGEPLCTLTEKSKSEQRLKDQSTKDISEPLWIDKPKKKMGNPAFVKGKKNPYTKVYWSKASTDKQDYPKVFETMTTLMANALDLMSAAEIADKLKISVVNVHAIKRDQIKTKLTAEKHINNIKKILNEYVVENNNWKEVSKPAHWLASVMALKELHKLIDTCLERMTQQDLALRMEIPQPAISHIFNRKEVRAKHVEDYADKLRIIERSTRPERIIPND